MVDADRTADRGPLRRAELDADPLVQLERWIDDASRTDLSEPTAACLATVDRDGRPDARMVLIRRLDHRGPVWFTNQQSTKGQQLEATPHGALVLYWEALHRQVRLRGPVAKTASEESDAYWAGRPRDSRVAARASQQSAPIASRGALEAARDEVGAAYPDEVPRPGHWGGYRLTPDEIEFWSGGPGRLHDRFLYRRADTGWTVTRLQP